MLLPGTTKSLKPTEYPNPELESYAVWMIHPYLIEELQPTSLDAYRERLMTFTPEDCWAEMSSEDITRLNLDRWFQREVRSLFQTKTGSESEPSCSDQKASAIPPLIRRLEYQGEKGRTKDAVEQRRYTVATLDDQVPLESSIRWPIALSQYRVGIMYRDKKAESGVSLNLFPQECRANVYVYVSQAGALLIIIELNYPAKPQKARQTITLSQAMDLNYIAAHLDDIYPVPVLVPKDVVKAIFTRTPNDQPLTPPSTYPLHDWEIPQCLSLWTCNSAQPSKIAVGPSLPRLIHDSLLLSLGIKEVKTYLASRGRIPTVTHIMLPVDEPQEQDVSSTEPVNYADSSEEVCSFNVLESLIVRSMRHPLKSDIAPLPLSKLVEPELQTVHITGSQRFHVTTEGMTAFGYASSQFDKTQWHTRVSREYLLTFILAYHQSMICQDFSWRSYTRHASGKASQVRRDNEQLLRRFREFDTNYNFSIVATQFNIQRLYRAARTALGVEKIYTEVRDELSSWLENETRQEQRALNSVAVVLLLASFVTLFINLHITEFDHGAAVSIKSLGSSIWLWLPLVISGYLIITRQQLRDHMKRVINLIIGSVQD